MGCDDGRTSDGRGGDRTGDGPPPVVLDGGSDFVCGTPSWVASPVAAGEVLEYWADSDLESITELDMLDCGRKPDGSYVLVAREVIDGCTDARWALRIAPYAGPGALYGNVGAGIELTHDGGSCFGDDGLNTTDCTVCTGGGVNSIDCPQWRYGDGSGPVVRRLAWRCAD